MCCPAQNCVILCAEGGEGMKAKKLTALLLAVLLVALSGCQMISDEQLQEYCERAREAGYAEGYEEGLAAIPESEEEDSATNIALEKDAAYKDGYEDGQNAGYRSGYSSGYEVGYNDGCNDAKQGYQATGSSAGSASSSGSGDETQAETQGATVYVTNTGSKYHNAGCRYLWNSSIAMSLSDAKASGYTACSVCNPPS